MLRPKHKFYELSEREREGEKVNDIYKLISQQEETMAQLLSKYQDKDAREVQYQQESRTIETTSFEHTTTIQRRRSATKIQPLSLQLPTISPNKNTNKKRHLMKSRDKLGDLNPYFVDGKGEKEKGQLRNHLERAYGTERLRKNRSKSRVESIEKEGDLIKKFQSERVANVRPQETAKEREKDKQPAQNELPTPLGYFKENVDNESSSSEEGQVPLNYYEREFRTKIRQQSLEETNFLYFSKNESMKDWTEGLLLLFEKHDKQLQSLRKKCKYLEKFDDNFFSIDIFKEG